MSLQACSALGMNQSTNGRQDSGCASNLGEPSPRMSTLVVAPFSRARRRICAAPSRPSPRIESGPPRCRCAALSITGHGTSSIEKAALAPTTCSAGRSPLGRIGRMLAEV